MESIKSYSKPKLRKSHSFLLQKTKSLFTECKDISEAQNNSMKSKNDQSTSTSTDEKSQNTLKKNFSYNKIKSLKDNENKLILTAKLKLRENPETRISQSKNKKNNNIMISENNNNINININNQKKLKDFPPPINNWLNNKYGFSYNTNNNKEKYQANIPHAFFNHLIIISNKLNINNKSKYWEIRTIQRIHSKRLSIVYYQPLK